MSPQLSPTLNPHQTYLIEEFVDEYKEQHMSRRDLLRRIVLITGSVPLAASTLLILGCGADSEEPVATATANPSTATPKVAATTAAATPSTPATPGVPANDPTLEVADVTFPGPATEIKAYLARPKAAGTYPGILIIHENRGLLDQIKDIARRYAKEGFVALAVDLVSRRGGGTGPDAAVNMGHLANTPPADLVADLTAGVAYLKGLPQTQGKNLGVTGYCFGGGYTWELIGTANPDIKAAAPYYGSATAPLEKLSGAKAAVLAVYGETDARITGQAPQVEEKLKASGTPYEIKIYPGAGHAFFNDTGAAYNAAAAADVWKVTLDWFRKYLA